MKNIAKVISDILGNKCTKAQVDDTSDENTQLLGDKDSVNLTVTNADKVENNENEMIESKNMGISEIGEINENKSDDSESRIIKNDLDNPEVRLKTAVSLSCGGYVLGFSMQGRSHIVSKTPCQDYHVFEDLGNGWLLSVTSDGAGSAREAARGSKANCDLALRLVKQLLDDRKWKENNYFPTQKEWYIEIRNVFEVMQAIIMRSATSQIDSYKKEQEKTLAVLEAEYKKAEDREKDNIQKRILHLKESMESPLEPRDFNATVILLLISPQGMMAAHIGDGRMGYLSQDGVWKSLMTPHKGDEASSTVFIPNNWNRQYNVPAFRMSDVYLPETRVVKELPKAFVLMSDGCESFSWTCKVYDKERNYYYDQNEPYAKFWNPLVEQLGNIISLDERLDEMIDIINVGTVGGKKELDDRTLLMGVLS